MERNWHWRLLMVLGLVAISVYYAAPSVIYLFAKPEVRRSKEALKAQTPDWLPKHRLNLGIDLQGGLHLVMGVDTDKAILDRADRVADEIFESMKEKKKALIRARREGDRPVLSLEMQAAGDWEALKEVLTDWDQLWEVQSHSDRVVTYAMRSESEERIRDDAVAQVQRTLRNRIDTYGVTEPEVRRRGKNSILIQIAGLTAEEEESVKEEIIGKTAQLEFKIVDDTSSFFADIAAAADKPENINLQYDVFEGPDQTTMRRPYLESSDKEALLDFLAKHPPIPDRVVRIQEIKDRVDPKKAVYSTWLLERRTPLTGDALVDAYPAFDSDSNNYHVAMKFDRKGAVLFEKLTRDNTKRKMAIVLDQFVDSAPIIEGPIPGGNARITLGGFKSQKEILDDAQALSVVLKAGSLPAPVYLQEQRTVGATMGDDAVTQGKQAMLYAFAIIIVMLLVYYRGAGAIGVAALVVNLLALFAGLAAFDATLTLPGIAGLALTTGMAVDANIIQFERIREELAAGKSARAAVDAGFDKAFSAIFDANVTTCLAALVLYQFGSGPIRGFATTLGMGVVINTFTAVVVPRLMLEFVTRGRRVQELSI